MDAIAVIAEHDSMQLERLLTDMTCPIHAYIHQMLVGQQHEHLNSCDTKK